ncbi:MULTISPECIES: hypothetical protein [Halolamina]|uniref:Uncharacterized protein n=1 Tax=Halolamina pelagica TaxID=699431 RepID=A0A1I5VJ00_9EURY|nr:MULTISPECIES: hypothetical protein [Halolamina]NHX37643.1 hypothetical protein [Halolamina sp. R1-12]SFQ07524.1 hypothetical protein SAMN05216277_11832 [Halolamina pelagica]
MPSENQPAGSGSRERFPRMQSDLGEDPARFLDRDLFDHGITRLEERDAPGYSEASQRVVRDADVSASGEMIRDRIRGIDKIAVARAWKAIERRLERTPEGGRDVVIGYLDDRIDELEADGERELPGHSPEALRELGVEKFEAVEKGDIVFRGPDGEITSRTEGASASQKLAAMADGGEGE